jgi:hypothetical protein
MTIEAKIACRLGRHLAARRQTGVFRCRIVRAGVARATSVHRRTRVASARDTARTRSGRASRAPNLSRWAAASVRGDAAGPETSRAAVATGYPARSRTGAANACNATGARKTAVACNTTVARHTADPRNATGARKTAARTRAAVARNTSRCPTAIVLGSRIVRAATEQRNGRDYPTHRQSESSFCPTRSHHAASAGPAPHIKNDRVSNGPLRLHHRQAG